MPSIPDRLEIDAATAWREAIAYLERQMPFHAHETFELRWRCCPESERALWKSLARWAAALTHLERGNAEGASSIARETMTDLMSVDHGPLTDDEFDGVLASLVLITRTH